MHWHLDTITFKRRPHLPRNKVSSVRRAVCLAHDDVSMPLRFPIRLAGRETNPEFMIGLIGAQCPPAAVLVKPGLPRVAVIGKADAGNIAQAIEDLVSGRVVNCRIQREIEQWRDCLPALRLSKHSGAADTARHLPPDTW